MSEQYYFRINGLQGENCITKITKKLNARQGVEVIEIDLETEMAVIKSLHPAEEISLLIDSAGYNSILIPD